MSTSLSAALPANRSGHCHEDRHKQDFSCKLQDLANRENCFTSNLLRSSLCCSMIFPYVLLHCYGSGTMIRLNDDVPVDYPGSVLAREPACRSAVPDSYQSYSCRCRPRPISRIPAISLYQLSAVTTHSIAHTSEGQTEAYTSACLQIPSKRQQRASPKVQKQNRLSVGISSSWKVFSTTNRRH